MAAKSSDLVDKMSEANLQADGQMEKPAQGAVDLREMEEEDSSPSCSLMWSPVKRLLLGCLNMKYCLEIWVTLTDELGDVPPTLSFLDSSVGGRYAVRSQSWTYLGGSDWPR